MSLVPTEADRAYDSGWRAAIDALAGQDASLRAKVIEECAARCDEYMRAGERLWKQETDGDRAALHLAQAYAARDIAKIIRALKD